MPPGLVAFNSVFQFFAFGVYVWCFALVLPPLLGMEPLVVGISPFGITSTQVFEAIAMFLGIPFAAGILSRYVGTRTKGLEWYDETFEPMISPLTLIALLFTVVVLFAQQGERISVQPTDVLLIAGPQRIYFLVRCFVSFGMGRGIGVDYVTTAVIGFTTASNDFELAIAVAVAVFGVGSGVAFATVVGPLIEVPVLLALLTVALYRQRRFAWGEQGDESGNSRVHQPAWRR